MITEKGETTTSYLLIQDARVSDSGKYSCSPSNADVAGVRVHVLANGECFFTLQKYFLGCFSVFDYHFAAAVDLLRESLLLRGIRRRELVLRIKKDLLTCKMWLNKYAPEVWGVPSLQSTPVQCHRWILAARQVHKMHKGSLGALPSGCFNRKLVSKRYDHNKPSWSVQPLNLGPRGEPCAQ